MWWIAARARPAISSGPTVRRTMIKVLLKEHVHTVSSCWFWITFECASNPSPKWHPEYRNFLIEKQEIIHSVLKKQKLWKSTKTPKVYCWLLVKHATEPLNITVKAEAFYQLWRAILPLLQVNSAWRHQRERLWVLQTWFVICLVPKTRAQLWFSEHLHLDSQHLLAPRRMWAKQRNTSLNWKCCLVRVNPRRIQRWTSEVSYLLCKRWTKEIRNV